MTTPLSWPNAQPTADQLMALALGTFICEQNPYTDLPGSPGPPERPRTGEMTLDPSWPATATAIELDEDYAHLWSFDGRPRLVKKALRITYTFSATYQHPSVTQTAQEHLLIGYEGGGGGI